MNVMRALSRTVAAIAVSLPLVVAGSAIANASSDGSSTGHHHKKHHKAAKFDVDQDIWQTTNQSNSNGPTNVSGNDNKFVTEQENEALQSATQNAFPKVR
jgi:hypothetical protein